MKVRRTKRLTSTTKRSSKSVTATILPNKKLLKLAAFLTKPDKIAARPMPVDIITAMASSAYLGIFFLIASMPRAAATQAAMAPRTGLKPKISPEATPASDVWARASPIMESRLRTMMIPIQGIIRDSKMPTKKAFCIKA